MDLGYRIKEALVIEEAEEERSPAALASGENPCSQPFAVADTTTMKGLLK